MDGRAVKELWDKGINSASSWSKKIPVHMVYFTSVADDKGKVGHLPMSMVSTASSPSALFGDAKGFPAPPPEPKKPLAGEADASTPAARRSRADNDFTRAMGMGD